MSRIRGRLEKLERDFDAGVRGPRSNPFDLLLQVVGGRLQIADIDPVDRDLVERLYHAAIGRNVGSVDRGQPEVS